jgi:hypothetical protein
MPRRADINIDGATGTAFFSGAGTTYLVQTPTGVLYCFLFDRNSDLSYRKSTDGGLTWTANVVVFAGTLTAFSIWYDRWSDISAGLIHCAYIESVTDDILYRTVNTESSDALSTQTTIFAGASTAAGGWLSITRARGGNVYCYGCIDAGAEGGFFRLPNANVPNGAWDAARTNPEALATTDQAILVPGFAADNQDIMCMFWDASANELSRYVHDDSGNSWAETSIATSMVELSAATAFPQFATAVDIANSQIVLVAWNGADTANADLKCWTITESAITGVTDVVLNGTDDQALAAIAIDTATGYWWAFYAGKSDGSETWPSAVNVYCKCSQDEGTTWGAETRLTTRTLQCRQIITAPRFTGPILAAYFADSGLDEFKINIEVSAPRANYIAGI